MGSICTSVSERPRRRAAARQPRPSLHAVGVCPATAAARMIAAPRERGSRMPDLTRFLRATQDGTGTGDDGAAHALYDEIRRLARTFMRSERASHTLPPTAVA